MKTAHTPGPWAANISELEASSSLVSIRTENGGYLICSDAGYQNAPLIAAAPDLLAALQELIEFAEPVLQNHGFGYMGKFEKARRAIAKATG